MASNYMLISNQTAHKWREFSPTSYKLLMEGSTTACIAKVALTTLTLGAPLVVALTWDGAASLKNRITPTPSNPTPAQTPPVKDKPGEKPTTKSSVVKAKDFVSTCVGYTYRATKWGYNRLPQRPLFRYPIITIVALTVISKTIGTGNFFSGLFNYGGPTLKTVYNWVVTPFFNAAGGALKETAETALNKAKEHGPEIVSNVYETTVNKGAALVEGACSLSDFVIEASVKGGKIMAEKAADPENWQNVPAKAWAVGEYAIKGIRAVLVFGAVTSTAAWLVGCVKSCLDNGEKAARKVASFPSDAANYVWDKTAGKAARAASRSFGDWRLGDNLDSTDRIILKGTDQHNQKQSKKIREMALIRKKYKSMKKELEEDIPKLRLQLVYHTDVTGAFVLDGNGNKILCDTEHNKRILALIDDYQSKIDRIRRGEDPNVEVARKRTKVRPGIFYRNRHGVEIPFNGQQAGRNGDSDDSSGSDHQSSSPRRARRARPSRQRQFTGMTQSTGAFLREPHFQPRQATYPPQQFGASNFGYGPLYGYGMPYQYMTPQQRAPQQRAPQQQAPQQRAPQHHPRGHASGSAAAAGATAAELASYRTGRVAQGSLGGPEQKIPKHKTD